MSIVDGEMFNNDMCKSFDASNKSAMFSIDKDKSAKLSLAISQNKSVEGALAKYQMPKLEFDT